jgi:hypothetical protein
MAENARGGTFADLIESIGHGTLVQKLEEKLLELSEAVKETGKVGTITLKLTVKKAGEFASVVADVKTTKPEHGSPESVFFFGAHGLQKEDPRQLKLKNLPASPASLRTLEGGKE